MAALFALLAVVLGALALYGKEQARQSTLETMEQGARSLAEAVSRAEENVLRSEADIEDLVVERLLDNARLVAELAAKEVLTVHLVEELAQDNNLHQVDVLDSQGRLRLSSSVVDSEELESWRESLEPLLNGAERAICLSRGCGGPCPKDG